MRIIPSRGLSINNVHAPSGILVEVEDALARELISYGVARPAPKRVEAQPIAPDPQPEPAMEAAASAPVVEAASVRATPNRKRRA